MLDIRKIRKTTVGKQAEIAQQKELVTKQKIADAQKDAVISAMALIPRCEELIKAAAQAGINYADVFDYYRSLGRDDESLSGDKANDAIVEALRKYFTEKGFKVEEWDNVDDGSAYYGTVVRISW